MNDNALVIEACDIRKTYRDGAFGRRRVEALKGVTLGVTRGSIFGLLGPNGAGKTTLIKVLLGIVRRSGGEAQLLGFPAGHRRGRAGVGYLPESHRIPRHLNGNTALEYFGRLSGLSYREIRARRPALLEQVGLGDWGRTSVKKYSKGMQQRLGLAQALLHDPPLLILDEPTDGVDPVGRTEMRELLQSLRQQGKTIFLNSHLLQEIELVCDKVAIMHQGELRREATVDELTNIAGKQLVFSVACSEADARAALDTFQVVSTATDAKSHLCHIVIDPNDDTDVDRCVDTLRAASISIQRITPQRRTLEEAFMDIIQVPTAEVID